MRSPGRISRRGGGPPAGADRGAPEVVWGQIADVNRHPEWCPDVVEVECEDFHQGCTYREVKKIPLGTDSATQEFVSCVARLFWSPRRYFVPA